MLPESKPVNNCRRAMMRDCPLTSEAGTPSLYRQNDMAIAK